MSQQNNAYLMCGFAIYGTISDVSRMNTGVIYVRPCYFKPGVDKEIPIFLRDAKKEHWATKENLKVGTKLTFRIRLDQYKGPMAIDLTTVDAAPKDAYSKPCRPDCIPDARGFRRIIDAARRKKLESSSNPVDQLKEFDSKDIEELAYDIATVIDGEERLSTEQKQDAYYLASAEFKNVEDGTIRASIFTEAVIETILDEDYDENDAEAVHDLFYEKCNSLDREALHEELANSSDPAAQLIASLGI